MQKEIHWFNILSLSICYARDWAFRGTGQSPSLRIYGKEPQAQTSEAWRQCRPVKYKLWYILRDTLAKLKDVFYSAYCGFWNKFLQISLLFCEKPIVFVLKELINHREIDKKIDTYLHTYAYIHFFYIYSTILTLF